MLKLLTTRHCEPTGRRKAPPDDRLRKAIQKLQKENRIASSLMLLAMTVARTSSDNGETATQE